MNFSKHIQFYCVDCEELLNPIKIDSAKPDYQCASCGKRYNSLDGIICLLSSQDQQSDLFKKYFDNYSQIACDDLESDIMPVSYKEIQSDKLIKYCGSKVNKNVLDIGSGQGFFLRRIPHTNKLAVDISLEYLKYLQKFQIEGVLVNAEKLPFKEAFDLIVLNDILEHVFHPEEVLKGVYRALKNQGIAVIRVPYKEDISVYLPEQGCQYEFVHLRSFDEDNLTQLIQSSGLKLKKIHYDGFSYSKLKKNVQDPLLNWLIKQIDEYVKTELYTKGKALTNLDAKFNNLPNFLGCVFFEPIEFVAVVQKIK